FSSDAPSRASRTRSSAEGGGGTPSRIGTKPESASMGALVFGAREPGQPETIAPSAIVAASHLFMATPPRPSARAAHAPRSSDHAVKGFSREPRATRDAGSSRRLRTDTPASPHGHARADRRQRGVLNRALDARCDVAGRVFL